MLCSSNAFLNVMEIGSGFNFMVTTMPGGYAKTEYLINGDFLDTIIPATLLLLLQMVGKGIIRS